MCIIIYTTIPMQSSSIVYQGFFLPVDLYVIRPCKAFIPLARFRCRLFLSCDALTLGLWCCNISQHWTIDATRKSASSIPVVTWNRVHQYFISLVVAYFVSDINATLSPCNPKTLGKRVKRFAEVYISIGMECIHLACMKCNLK